VERDGGSGSSPRPSRCSLGATLFHLVSGLTPFTGPPTMAVVACHLHDPLPDPRQSLPELPGDPERRAFRAALRAVGR
jgi:hypothetical protein